MPALAKDLRSHRACPARNIHFARMRTGWLIALFLCLSSSLWATTTQFSGVTTTLNLGSTTLDNPYGVFVDTTGIVYISDTFDNRILQVNSTGVVSVVATSSLMLATPTAVTKDAAGAIYIADAGNSRIVKVDAAGNATVVNVGSLSLYQPEGVAIDLSGNLFIADTGNSRIIKVTSAGVASIYAISGLSVQLNTPIGLATDPAGDLYIADANNSRVVLVTSSGAGSVVPINGGVSLIAPYGISLDLEGNLQIADAGNNQVVYVPPSGANAKVYNLATSFASPGSVAVDVFGKVYIADSNNSRIVTFAPNNVDFGHVQTSSSTGTVLTLPFTISSSNTLTGISALTLGAPSLDFNVVAGSSTCAAGSTNTTCTVQVKFAPTAPGQRLGAVVLAYAGGALSVPLSGMSDGPVATFTPGTATALSPGTSTLSYPFQVALDGAGNFYVANYNGSTSTVVKFPPGGGTGTVVNTGSVVLTNPTGVAVDGAGDLFIANLGNSQIVEVPATGTPLVLASGGLLSSPSGLWLDASNNLYIANFGNGKVLKLTPAGVMSAINTGSYTFPGSSVSGVAVDRSGNLYLSDSANARVVKVTAAGVASLVATTGVTLNAPRSVAVDGAGNLYILDTHVVKVATNGVVSILSTGSLSANGPYGLAVDPSGNVFISDFSGNRILKLNLAASSLAYATTAIGSTSTDSPKAATVTNIGNQPLVFSALSSYPTDFALNSSDGNLCTASISLVAGASCDIAANFIPQSAGNFTESVTITDNTWNTAGSTQQISFTGTGFMVDSTATAVLANPSTITIGSTVNLSATVTDTTNTSTIPTGPVTYSDLVGTTGVSLNGGTAITLNGSGVAALSNVTLSGTGTHTITANYAGVTNSFKSSTNTATVTVNKATTTITGPSSQPVMVTYGQTGSIAISLAGSSGLPSPSGSLTYSITSASNATVASSTAALTAASATSTASIPVANTFTAGAYVVHVSYAGDSNYQAPTSITVSLQIGQITPTAAFTPPSPSPITYGTALGSILTTTATNNSNSVAGSFTYTATVSGGAATAVTSASVLAGGSYTLTALFTPTDTTDYTTATAIASLTVNKRTTTITGPQTQPVMVIHGQTGSISISLSGYSGLASPSGSLIYGITSPTSSFAVSGPAALSTSGSASVASIPISNGLSTGTYNVSVNYAGDSNYQAPTSITVGLQIIQNTPVVAFGAPSPIAYGTALGGILTATASYNSSSVAGSFTYTATPSGGSASAVTTSSVLAVGSYTLTALFTPTDTTTYTTASAQASLTVNKTTTTITGPQTQPVTVIHGQTGSIPISLSGYSGIASPSGSVTYSITSPASSSAVSGSAALSTSGSASIASIPISNAFATGTYSVSVSYVGDSNYLAPTSIAVSLQVIQNTPVVAFGAPQPITYGTTLGGILTATASYNSNPVAGSFTYTATPSGGSASAVNMSSVLTVGTYTLTALFTPTDTTTYTTASAQVTLAVNKATPTITLTTTNANPSAQTSITFTATLAASGSSPTTTVNFFDGSGTTPIGSGTIVAGAAIFPTSTLSVGIHSITAVYVGDANFNTVTSSAVQVTVKQDIPVVSFANPPAIVYGAQLGAILNASVAYNSIAVAGSFAYTATSTGSSATVVTSASVLGTGTYTLTALFTPTDTTTYATVSAQVQLTVNKATPGIALITSSAAPFTQNAILFTATITSTPTPATGTVSFFDGSSITPLGTSAVVAGVATFTVPTLSVGTHLIAAIYSGDLSFNTITSAAITETVQDFNLNISTSAGSTTTETVLPGGTASYQLIINPMGATTFAAAVALTASGLPAGATYTLTPSTLVAGSAMTTVTLVIQVPQQTAMLRHGNSLEGGLATVALALLLLPFTRRMRRSARTLERLIPMALLLIAGAAAMTGLSGCGSGTGFFGQKQQTYAVSITGTSGALAHSTNVTLVVQ